MQKRSIIRNLSLHLLAILFITSYCVTGTGAYGQHLIDMDQDFEGLEITALAAHANISLTQGSNNGLSSGDLNNDGFADLVIGAGGRVEPTVLIPGEVFIKFGPFDPCGTVDMTEPSDLDIKIIGADPEDALGRSTLVSDVNGDGIADLIVSGLLADGPANGRVNTGEIYVFFGPLSAGTLDINVDADWTLYGAEDHEPLGADMATGDLNDDGRPDLVIGAPGSSNANLGRAHIFFGPLAAGSQDLAIQSADVVVEGSLDGDELGFSLGVADLSGDGKDDLVVGAIGSLTISRGEAYTFFGPFTGGTTLDRSDADVVVYGTGNVQSFGQGLDIGDLDNDGQADLAIASGYVVNPITSEVTGAATVLFGPLSTGTTVAWNQTDLTVYLSEKGQIHDLTVGDVSGDGIDDLALGAPTKSPNGRGTAGEVEIAFGPLATGVLNLATSPADLRIIGKTQAGQLGRGMTLADLTGDGDLDLTISASFHAPIAGTNGEVYIYDGPVGFRVDAGAVPACVTSSPLTVAGSISSGQTIDQIDALINGNTAGTVCLGCGVDPSFSFDFPLAACDNVMRFRAVDDSGQVGVSTRKTRLDGDGPVFEACEDIEIEVAEGINGTTVPFNTDPVDACDGSLPSSCTYASGSFFPLGVTEVSCDSTDTCGNPSTCDFRVIVETETFDNTECRVDDFSQSPTAIWTLDQVGDAGTDPMDTGASAVGGELHLKGTGSSLYDDPQDHTTFFHQSVTGDFFVETEITSIPVDLGGQYRKGGVMVRAGLEDDAPRVMVQLIPHFPQGSGDTMAIQFHYRDVLGQAFELGSTVQNISLPVRVGISRRGDDLTVYFARDGQPWVQPAGGFGSGEVTLNLGPDALVGLNVTSYDPQQPFTMGFNEASICQPNDVDPGPVTVGCNAQDPVDVIYLLDMSGSMARVFDGSSKLEASRQAIHRLNDTFSTLVDGSQGALITYSLDQFETDPAEATQVVSSFADFATVSSALDGLNFNAVAPLDASPTALALAAAKQLLQTAGNPAHRQVLIWFTDNLPNVDDQLNGGTVYKEAEVRALSILNGTGGFLPRGEVAWLGNENFLPDGTKVYDGEVLADAMAGIEFLLEAFPTTLILSAVPRDDGSSTPVISEELLDYAALQSGGAVFGGTDSDQLIAAMSDLLAEAYCNIEGGASVSGGIWRDIDGDGTRDSGENGVYGVTVELVDNTQTVLASAATGSSGTYQFIDIPVGSYDIRIEPTSLPSELTIPTFDPDGVGSADVFAVTLAAFDAITDGDFGYAETTPNTQPLTACVDDDFNDGILEADWRSTYLGNADQGTADESNGTLKLSGDGTTLFGASDNGHYLYRHVNGDFRAELDVVGFPVDQGGAYRKAGLMVRDGFGSAAPRVMVQFVPHWAGGSNTALQFGYRATAGTSDALLASNVDNVALPARLAIERQGNVFTVEYSTDGGTTWIQPSGQAGGSISLTMSSILSVGLDTVSYDAQIELTAEFDDWSLCPLAP